MNSPRRRAHTRNGSTPLASQPSMNAQLQVEQQHMSALADPFGHTLPRRKARVTSPPLFIPGFRYYPPVSRIRGTS
ncbi:hypothetical protein [Pseudoclavibacter helvolus]|uniref:hypothetical protein n=1 Tax=Pseudoclavibacter helvolus TaxID=255205 RepID=UPI003C710A54